MRAELYRPDAPDAVVAVAIWDGSKAALEVLDGGLHGLGGVLRPTPVLVEDASYRRLGTHGEVLVHPGSLEWFRAALLTRAPEMGLSVRFLAGDVEGGWDPASDYRTFGEQVGRLAARP